MTLPREVGLTVFAWGEFCDQADLGCETRYWSTTFPDSRHPEAVIRVYGVRREDGGVVCFENRLRVDPFKGRGALQVAADAQVEEYAREIKAMPGRLFWAGAGAPKPREAEGTS